MRVSCVDFIGNIAIFVRDVDVLFVGLYVVTENIVVDCCAFVVSATLFFRCIQHRLGSHICIP